MALVWQKEQLAAGTRQIIDVFYDSAAAGWRLDWRRGADVEDTPMQWQMEDGALTGTVVHYSFTGAPGDNHHQWLLPNSGPEHGGLVSVEIGQGNGPGQFYEVRWHSPVEPTAGPIVDNFNRVIDTDGNINPASDGGHWDHNGTQWAITGQGYVYCVTSQGSGTERYALRRDLGSVSAQMTVRAYRHSSSLSAIFYLAHDPATGSGLVMELSDDRFYLWEAVSTVEDDMPLASGMFTGGYSFIGDHLTATLTYDAATKAITWNLPEAGLSGAATGVRDLAGTWAGLSGQGGSMVEWDSVNVVPYTPYEAFEVPALAAPEPTYDYLSEIGFPRDFGGFHGPLVPVPLPPPMPLVFTYGPDIGANRRRYRFDLATGQPKLHYCVWAKSASGEITPIDYNRNVEESTLQQGPVDMDVTHTSFPHRWIYAVTAADSATLPDEAILTNPEHPAWTLRWYAPDEPPTYFDVVAADAPALWWRLNFLDTGATAFDSSGYDRRGTKAGTITTGSGLLVRTTDEGAVFSGDDHVRRDPGEPWMNTKTFTLEALIKPTALGDYREIWDRDGDIAQSSSQRMFQFRLEPNGALILILFNGSSPDSVISSAGAVPVNTRAHVAATVTVGTTTTTATLFVNGYQVATKTFNFVAKTTVDWPLRLGTHNFGGSLVHNFVGTIDEAAVYDYALHPDRIAIHAQAALTRAYPPVIGTPPSPPVVEWFHYQFGTTHRYYSPASPARTSTHKAVQVQRTTQHGGAERHLVPVGPGGFQPGRDYRVTVWARGVQRDVACFLEVQVFGPNAGGSYDQQILLQGETTVTPDGYTKLEGVLSMPDYDIAHILVQHHGLPVVFGGYDYGLLLADVSWADLGPTPIAWTSGPTLTDSGRGVDYAFSNLGGGAGWTAIIFIKRSDGVVQRWVVTQDYLPTYSHQYVLDPTDHPGAVIHAVVVSDQNNQQPLSAWDDPNNAVWDLKWFSGAEPAPAPWMTAPEAAWTWESNTVEGWTSQVSLALLSPGQDDSQYSLHVTRGPDGPLRAWSPRGTAGVPTAPGRKYEIKFGHLTTSFGSAKGIEAGVVWFDAAGNELSQSSRRRWYPVATGAWTTLRTEVTNNSFTAPADAAFVAVELLVTNWDVGGGPTQFDNVELWRMA